eukprot:TRINITY_DN1453_c0_g1_i1.p1 TRINITY_DN1453_c0_g1~~TRINITY_DN1453_c0_g1_i1.p1  ORF type:complete len:412 (-),score=113.61 TRINITY_DN1453_c0_g1_i1:180-1415(-)
MASTATSSISFALGAPQTTVVSAQAESRASFWSFSSSFMPGFAVISTSSRKLFYSASQAGNTQRSQKRTGVVALAVNNGTKSANPKSVLIVNTNSGGHAAIGFWLSQQLAAAGHEVTILTVGEENSDKMNKPPFVRFSELREGGVKTIWGNPAALASTIGPCSFDVVVDNNGKDLDTVKPVIDWAVSGGVMQFLFVSSAGIYKNTDYPPHVEGDAVKEDAGHVLVEKYLQQQLGSKWASFRPQYMTGSGNNKDCEEWFFDRIVRGRPVPIPAPGIQLTNVAHISDVSSMIALAIEQPAAAAGGLFNAVSDRTVTLDGLVRMCAKAAGKEAKIVHYDPKAVGVDVKKAFPFRNQHFYAEPRAAKVKLAWTNATDLQSALNARYLDYLAVGRHRKDIKFDLDDKILAAISVTV